MKPMAALLGAGCLWAATALAQSPVTLTIADPSRSTAIPAGFSGLSFETQLALPGTNGRHFFSAANKPLIALFKTLGIHNLRIGGNTADMPATPIPTLADIDSLFAFAKAARVKVIYTLRLRNGDVTNDAAIAQYIEQHYRDRLACFAIGNEPDFYKKVYPVIKDYSAFRRAWEQYATIVAAAAPGARFCGPCAGQATSWSREFATDCAKRGMMALITQHDYPGGSSRRTTNAAAARDQMLSPGWLDHYETFYTAFATTAASNGMACRLEEAGNFSDGGVKDASDTFAAALWSLDYLHWWAAHGADGINFHGRRWVPNCVIHPVPVPEAGGTTNWSKNYNVRPIGYGLKAFDLGGHGSVQSLSMSNPDALNLTAYAVRDGRHLFVTLLNKEHAPGAREADVSIFVKTISAPISVIYLAAPTGHVTARAGVTLGGASIQDDGSWHGKWTPLKSNRAGCCTAKVPPATAAIVRIPL